MTPLAKWNPFKLQKFDNERAFFEANSGKSGENPEDPMFGYSEDAEFKITPASLFGKANTNGLADTGLGGRHIRNSDGLVGKVVSSGTRIITPRITVDSKSFGVRLRYPIFPIMMKIREVIGRLMLYMISLSKNRRGRTNGLKTILLELQQLSTKC
eukprot:UN23155